MVLMWLKDTEECRKGTMAVRKKGQISGRYRYQEKVLEVVQWKCVEAWGRCLYYDETEWPSQEFTISKVGEIEQTSNG